LRLLYLFWSLQAVLEFGATRPKAAFEGMIDQS
jgi:hypothetical protein